MKSVLEYLEQSAARLPDKAAFADETGHITFAQLRDAARRVGTDLAACGCLRRPVALLMEKSLRTIELMMGVVYAGGFYVMMDAAQPEERLNRTLETLQAPVLITTPEHAEKAARLQFAGRRFLADEPGRGPADDVLLARIAAQQKDVDPLYVLFTSGSTGVPKGVVISHRSTIDFIDCFTEIFGITEDDILGNQAPWDFDVSVKDIYSGLRTGATVQLIPRLYFSVPNNLLDYLDEKRVTSLTWAVSALTIVSTLDGFAYRRPACIRRVMFSGETMPVRHLNYWREAYPDAMFVNLYGPTEITCNCTYYIIDRDFAVGDVIPIGSAFPNETVFLLDDQDREVTGPGTEGEIVVSGTALGLGYYNNAEQTARAFVQNPLNTAYLEPVYRTGDLGFYNERGELCFASRKDFQIKHLGHRIELGEIETALEKVPQIKKSCCLYQEERHRIWCFYMGEIDKKDLAEAAAAHLPDYMIPNVFRQLDALPLNKNSKVDRRALKEEMTKRRKA